MIPAIYMRYLAGEGSVLRLTTESALAIFTRRWRVEQAVNLHHYPALPLVKPKSGLQCRGEINHRISAHGVFQKGRFRALLQSSGSQTAPSQALNDPLNEVVSPGESLKFALSTAQTKHDPAQTDTGLSSPFLSPHLRYCFSMCEHIKKNISAKSIFISKPTEL